MNSRAQAAAPFELLVAIIIMTFVIIIGSQMLGQVNTQICLNHVGSEMSDFVNYLEETSNKKTTNTFRFNPETICFDQSEHQMKIVREQDSKTCSNKCGIPQDTCYVMIFHTSDVAGGYKETCINLPVYTNFETDELACPTTSAELSGYIPIVPSQKIPFGNYVLKNISKVGETWPNICFYHKR